MKDIFFGRFAYIEFADKDSVTTAQALDESLFKGRQIKVNLEADRKALKSNLILHRSIYKMQTCSIDIIP